MVNSAEIAGKVLYQDERHSVIWLGTDEKENEGVVQTNQYLVVDGGKAALIDPGGVHLFARVVSAISRHVELDKIEMVTFSHQDPDVSSGIALWMGVTKARVYISSLWMRFLPHFGIVDLSRITPIEGSGRSLPLNLRFVPAHFLHSPGNWCVYDPISKIIFSGDIGAAVFPNGGQYVMVDDFEAHKKLIDGFHKRVMASNKAVQAWLRSIAGLDIDMIAPQHGAIFPREAAVKFLAWLKTLECGVDRIDEINRSGA